MNQRISVLLLMCFAAIAGCHDDDDEPTPLPPLVVNSVDDVAAPAAGTVTLRSALAAAASGQAIHFDGLLDGRTQGLGDEAWREFFGSGRLAENPSITIEVDTRARLSVQRWNSDQLGVTRPASAPSDIGAIERP